MREDLKNTKRAIDEFERHPSQESWCDEEVTAIHSLNENVPAPFRGLGYLLRMLPPGSRVIGVLALAAVVIAALLTGVKFF